MEPRPPWTSRPEADRRRSRSPAASASQDESRRARGPSPAPSRDPLTLRQQRFQQRFEEAMKESAASRRDIEVEEERRRNLGPMGRLEEDGQKLRDKILSSQDMFVTFEVSRSARARCRANDCCYVQKRDPAGKTIEQEYRIRVDGADVLAPTTPHYYHVICFDSMVHLEHLPPTKLRLDPESHWGLLIRKWFQHRGCINLDKLASYIDEFKAYSEKHPAFEAAAWSKCLDSGHTTTCTCPPKPQEPEKLILKDYATEEGEQCSVLEVMEHPNFHDLRDKTFSFTSVSARGFERTVWRQCPEIEEGESEQARSGEASSSHENEETKGGTGV